MGNANDHTRQRVKVEHWRTVFQGSFIFFFRFEKRKEFRFHANYFKIKKVSTLDLIQVKMPIDIIICTLAVPAPGLIEVTFAI